MRLKNFTLGAIAILFACSFKNTPTKSVIIIDAAHGGTDNGATTPIAMEKEITLSIAQKIKSLNSNENIELVLLRDKDEFKSLDERTKIINGLKPAMIISLHTNFMVNNEEKSGVEIFVSKQNKHYASSLAHANKLQEVMMQKGKTNTVVMNKNLHLLRESDCDAMSVELGYLSNLQERDYLLSESGQTEIAQTINSFINKK